MKLKKIILLLLIITLLPLFAVAEEYPYLPTPLKEKVISVFDIDISDKTQLYEKVNIYGDLDAWMIGWFNDSTKTVAGITDLGDIIYYSVSDFTSSPILPGNGISTETGKHLAREFLDKIMPGVTIKFLRNNAYEYTFAECHNGIPLLGRTATVVVDKQSGEVTFYKGFGKSDCTFEALERLIAPQHAFEIFYNRIGFELVYNTVFDHSSRLKTIRPMYILNRSNFKAVNAQSGKTETVKMYDYNYYYDDTYYDERYYYDNNIHPDEKIFTPDKEVFGVDISSVTESPFFSLSSGYLTRIVSGKLSYYSNANGSENSYNAYQVNFVPAKFARQREKFAQMFDEGNMNWFKSQVCDTAFIFARAYIDAETGLLLDYETVKNPDFTPVLSPSYNQSRVDRFVSNTAKGYVLQYCGGIQLGKHEYLRYYARYYNGVRVIGEGVCTVYNSYLREITDYSLVVTESDFIPKSFMKSREEMKDTFRDELKLSLCYIDKNETEKFVVYDAAEPGISFDPLTGQRIDRHSSDSSFICTCTVGSDAYTFGGVPFTAPAPIVSSEKLFLPLSVIAAPLGYDITFDDGIVISGGADYIRLDPDSTLCTINGTEKELDIPPLISSDIVYISAQSARLIFDLFINWNSLENLIYIIR